MNLATDMVLINILLFVLGLVILIKGSDWFVDASAFIAKHFNISEVVIGLTLVSIGTSLPELATNIYASVSGEPEIVLGNVIGSNITNICLVLSVGLLCKKGVVLNISKIVFRRDVLTMISIFTIYTVLAYFQRDLTRIDGSILLLISLAYSLYLLKTAKSEIISDAEEHLGFNSLTQSSIFLILGIIMISIGSKMLVDTVVKTAELLSISKAIISATVVAFGTSVPELAVTVTSIRKGNNDMALGNIVGSCIYNLTLVLSISALILPVKVAEEFITFTNPLMLASGVILTMMITMNKKLKSYNGVALLLLYIIFIGYNLKNII